MAEFLAGHQAVAAPIIEWGGLFLLLFVILSPFLIIRHHYFKPTRWWHVLVAYLASFLVVTILIVVLFSESVDEFIKQQLLRSNDANANYKFRESYDSVSLRTWFWLLLIYPLSTFFVTKPLYQKGGAKWFLTSLMLGLSIGVTLLALSMYAVLYGLGQIGMEHF